MACLTALYSQSLTLLSVPHEILLLQHKVFREYAKIAVGPDFVHTLPSFLILAAMTIVLVRNPPSINSVAQMVTSTTLYKTLQVMVCWVVAITGIWVWLILQRLLYCCVWAYWSYEFEYRDITYQWWQRVWSSYYPPPLKPPIMSAGFISWILSMSFAAMALDCAVSTDRVRSFIAYALTGLRYASAMAKCYAKSYLKRILRFLLQQHTMMETSSKNIMSVDESKGSSICDECRSEVSSEMNNRSRREIHPISYGTNWTPKPSFSGYKDPQRKMSMKSLHTVAVVNDINDSDKLSPRHLRHRRCCHTVIPSNSSDKSSDC